MIKKIVYITLFIFVIQIIISFVYSSQIFTLSQKYSTLETELQNLNLQNQILNNYLFSLLSLKDIQMNTESLSPIPITQTLNLLSE